MGGALCTVCAYVRSARSMPTQLGRPLSAFPAHTPGHLAHGAKGPKWGFSGGGGMCGCMGYRGVLGCSDHDPASRSSSRRADHSANCRSIRPWFMTQPACTAIITYAFSSHLQMNPGMCIKDPGEIVWKIATDVIIQDSTGLVR